MPTENSVQTLSRTLVVPCAHGIHMRVAARIVRLANTFESAIWFSASTRSGNAKSILALLELGAAQGESLTITALGPDAERALDAVSALHPRRRLPAGCGLMRRGCA